MVSRLTFTHTLLSIIVDGRSRGIVRTDPVPKPGVSSTLPSKEKGNAVDVESNRGSSPHKSDNSSEASF